MKTTAAINLAPPPRWGNIKGILTDQPDLKAALDAIHSDIAGTKEELLNNSADFVGLIDATMEI